MVITGDIRSGGKQLYDYLLAQGENEHIQILDVNGRENASPAYMRQTMIGMQLSSEMTKSHKAYMHVQLSPAYGEDKGMDYDRWNRAADILAEETGFEGQRRVIVLHTKKGRTHAHVVFERYHHATGKMIDNKFSKYKMNDAREKIELALGHKVTPRRNMDRDSLKDTMTTLWQANPDAKQFIKAAKKEGYIIAEGTPKRPFRVVDENGRSFDLVRQLDGVRTKEVRSRLRDEKLIPEKQAIEQIRAQQESDSKGGRERQKMAHAPKFAEAAQAFAENRETFKPDMQATQQQKNTEKFAAFEQAKETIMQPVPEKESKLEQAAVSFAANREKVTGKEAQKQKLIDQQKQIQQKKKQRPKI